MTPSLKGWPTKAKQAPSPHEVKLAPLGTNPAIQSLEGIWSVFDPQVSDTTFYSVIHKKVLISDDFYVTQTSLSKS